MHKVIQKTNFDIGSKMSNFLATGNLVSPTGLDLQQASGFTIVAEKLNWLRYISHFRSIHRGAFFAELKTTTVRKLLPEAWGMSRSVSERAMLMTFRILVPGTYARRLAMWSPQPSLKNMSNRQPPTCRQAHTRTSRVTWHDWCLRPFC
jgi:hypothetical protein